MLALCFDLKLGIWWIIQITFSLIKPQILAVSVHTQWLCCVTGVNGDTATEVMSFSEDGN